MTAMLPGSVATGKALPFPPSPGAGTRRSRVVPAASLHFPCCGQVPKGHVLRERERERQVQRVPKATECHILYLPLL